MTGPNSNLNDFQIIDSEIVSVGFVSCRDVASTVA